MQEQFSVKLGRQRALQAAQQGLLPKRKKRAVGAHTTVCVSGGAWCSCAPTLRDTTVCLGAWKPMLRLPWSGKASAGPVTRPSSCGHAGCTTMPHSATCRRVRHQRTGGESHRCVHAALAASSAPCQADAPTTRPRGIVDVAEHVALNSIAAELLPTDGSCSAPAAKSLLVLSGGRPLLVIMLAQHRMDERRLAALTLCARRALRLATPTEVLALSGFAVGAVPPFGHTTALPTLLDAAVRACICAQHALCLFGSLRQVQPHPTLLCTCMPCRTALHILHQTSKERTSKEPCRC